MAEASPLERLFGLRGKVAVVSGGTGGLGAAAAAGLASAGATVVVVGRDEARGAQVVSRIEEAGGAAALGLADVASPAAVEDLARRVHARHGAVDILVNGAGVFAAGPAVEVTAGEWDRVFAVNVTGTFEMCQAFGRRMIERGSGRIVNVASTDGLVGVPDQVAYSTSKAAVVQITRCLAVEWVGHGVHVNAIAPTEFATPMTADLLERPDYRAWVKAAIPIGRVGQPEEIVGALLYLVSPAASMVVGHTLLVDGGRTVV